MDGIKNFIKIIFICIFGFGILFEAFVILALVLVMDEYKEEKEIEQLKYNIPYMTVNEVYDADMALEVFPQMTEEDLEYMRVYILDIAIQNAGQEDINEYYDLSYLVMKDEEDIYLDTKFMSYYEGDDIHNYNHHQIIPTGKTGTVKYMLLVNDNNEVNELKIYTIDDEEHYVSFDFSNF